MAQFQIVIALFAIWNTPSGLIAERAYEASNPPTPVYSTKESCRAALKTEHKVTQNAGHDLDVFVSNSSNYPKYGLNRKGLNVVCSGKPLSIDALTAEISSD